MIGHLAGTVAQIVITTSCNVILNRHWVCVPLGVVIHEGVVEPLTDALVTRAITSITTPLKGGELVVRMIGALVTTQITEKFTHNMLVEGSAGLVGSYIGGQLYDYYYDQQLNTDLKYESNSTDVY